MRRATWKRGDYYDKNDGSFSSLSARSILASDWEVVEEPAPAKPACGHISCDELRNTIARLTRERDEADAKATRFEQRFQLITDRIRDLAEDWGK